MVFTMFVGPGLAKTPSYFSGFTPTGEIIPI
jgi:hypothetical protein